jgi:hypothetical protein
MDNAQAINQVSVLVTQIYAVDLRSNVGYQVLEYEMGTFVYHRLTILQSKQQIMQPCAVTFVVTTSHDTFCQQDGSIHPYIPDSVQQCRSNPTRDNLFLA